jgi:hypothetical protein
MDDIDYVKEFKLTGSKEYREWECERDRRIAKPDDHNNSEPQPNQIPLRICLSLLLLFLDSNYSQTPITNTT